MPQHHEADLSGAVHNRRSFIAKFAGAVFAAPMISSFALDGIAQAQPGQRIRGGLQQYLHNQSCGNQNIPNQWLYNQHLHNQYLYNQWIMNQHMHNQYNDHDHHDPSWWAYGECFPFDNHRHRRPV
jgi:hypothetical protein